MLVAAAYLQANNPGSGSAGAITANDASYIAKRMRVFGAGINYTFGPATVGFTYTNSNDQSPTGNGYLGTPSAIIAAGATVSAIKYQNFEVNGFYQMTPALSVGAAYTLSLENYNSSAGKAKPKIHQMGLMADYTLSKRTDAYVQAAYQHVAGDKTKSILDQGFVLGAQAPSSTANQVVVRLALRHKF